MGYSLYLKDPETNKRCSLKTLHISQGSRYCPNGSYDAEFSITYNYSEIFNELFGEEGIRSIYGLNGHQSAPILVRAILKLKSDDGETNYWKATQGNVKIALEQLLHLAFECPDAVWDGD